MTSPIISMINNYVLPAICMYTHGAPVSILATVGSSVEIGRG